ncbi:hypothetical protein D3C85_1291400 [compost metagenome]
MQLLAVQQILDVADEGVFFQVLASANWWMPLQIFRSGIQTQGVIGQFGDDVGTALGALQGDDYVCLMARETHHARNSQQVDTQAGMATRQLRQLPRHKLDTVSFSRADPHTAGHSADNALPLLLLDGQERTLHRLGLSQQAPPRLGQLVAGAAADKQRAPQTLLQRLDTAGYRGVIDLQMPRSSRQLARPRQLEEITQIVPVHT